MFAFVDDAVTAELCGLYQALQNCLDLREKYMKRSCQRWEDDPRNRDDWEVYPPPPPPSWPLPSPEEQARRREQERRREEDPVGAVGSDFEWEKCKIPGNHEVCIIHHHDKVEQWRSLTLVAVCIWHGTRRLL